MGAPDGGISCHGIGPAPERAATPHELNHLRVERWSLFC
jgi:hypothetical protein